MDYFEVLRRSYINAGYPIDSVPSNIYGDPRNPSVPRYIWPNNCGAGGKTGICTSVDEAGYAYPSGLVMPGSAGTNWWDAVFGTGFVGDYNLDVAGGSQDNRYGVSFNYFHQKGTADYNEYKRGSLRDRKSVA